MLTGKEEFVSMGTDPSGRTHCSAKTKGGKCLASLSKNYRTWANFLDFMHYVWFWSLESSVVLGGNKNPVTGLHAELLVI